MVNSDSFGHLPLAGGEEEANDFLRDKWEAHRRTSLDAANREKEVRSVVAAAGLSGCLLYTSPSPRDQRGSRMPSSA